MEVAVPAFAPLLGLLDEVPDPRRAEGKLYRLPHVLLFSILAIVSGGNSYRSVTTFIDVHRRRLNRAFGLERMQRHAVPVAVPQQGRYGGRGRLESGRSGRVQEARCGSSGPARRSRLSHHHASR
jgi:hypothetical protein